MRSKKFPLPNTYLYAGRSEGEASGIVTLCAFQLGQSAVEFLYQGAVVDVHPLYDADLFHYTDDGGVLRWLLRLHRLRKKDVALRCFLPVEPVELASPFQVRDPANLARRFLSTHQEEIRWLLDRVSEELVGLRYGLGLSLVKGRSRSIGFYGHLFSGADAGKIPAVRRVSIVTALAEMPDFLQRQIDPAEQQKATP